VKISAEKTYKKIQNNNSPKISNKKPIPKIKKKEELNLPNGFINEELKEKIGEIKVLYSQIRDFLDSKSLSTNVKIFNGFPALKRKDSKGLSFQDVKFLFIQNEKSSEELILIKDLNTSDFVYLTESGKVLDTKQEKINFVRFFEKPKFLSQEKIDIKTNEESFKNLVNNTLTNLKNFKTYIDNQGWRVRKDKEILEQDYGYIDSTLQEKISSIKAKYNNINSIFNSMSYYNASKIKSAYGNILTSATSRLEFINSNDSNLNIAFDFSKNKYGEFYKIARYSGGQNVEELYLITPDGKIVKNAVKNQGLKSPFPTGGQADIKFYSQEELNNLDLKELENILDIFNEKISDYENFVLEINKKAVEKQTQKIEKIAEQNKVKITFDAVKTFFDKTILELQTSVENKNSLETLADDLKIKFEDFLSQFKSK